MTLTIQGTNMTEDEFINLPEDSRVRLTGPLEHVFGFESDVLFIMKKPGDTDGPLTTDERFAMFHESLAHVFNDDGIMRFQRSISGLEDIEVVRDEKGQDPK